jgi:outer membrane receptor protein involved in Fe transport
LAVLTGTTVLRGQTAAADQPKPAESTPDEDIVVLSPFTVEASEDSGYAATDTLAGSRIRTQLKDVGAAISVVTEQFMRDTNSKNASDLLVYTTNTEVSGQGGNFLGQGDGAILDSTAATAPVANTRVRGLAEADNLRDFFLTDIPWDSYNVGRVDLQRGANSILFGIGSPAGIINSSINSASLKDGNKVELQVASFGSTRATLDLNKVLLDDELALRFAALDDRTNYRQKPAYRDDSRVFGALRYDPKFLRGDGARTTLRVNFEHGEIHANYPRLTPPIDCITPWYATMGKATYQVQNANNYTTFGNALYEPGLGAAGQRVWDGIVTAFDADSATQGISSAAQAANYPAGGTNNTENGGYKGIQSYDKWAFNSRLPGYIIQPFKSRSLTDASVFDFYNNLLEGNNKSNWNRFNAFNAQLSQTFFGDRIGIDLAYDWQDSKWGWKNAISGDAAAITVDVMQTLVGGAANPNVGRAMVIMGGGSSGSGAAHRVRESYRATAFGELNFKDIIGKQATLAKILGRHRVTGAWTRQEMDYDDRTWANWFIGSGYINMGDVAVGQSQRDVTPLIYLSEGSVADRTSASGLHLSRITAEIVPSNTTVTNWNTTSGSFVTYDVPIVNPNGDSYDVDTRPYSNASKNRQIIDSQVAVWQGFLFDGNLVPMVGWRKDIARSYDAGTPAKVTGIVSNINDPAWRLPTGSEENGVAGRSFSRVSGETKTYSVVAHMPKFITNKLPGHLGFSVFYNQSENFKPDASRKDILGNPVAAPTGKTKDYGVTFSALDGKVMLKIGKYKTNVFNTTLSGNLANSYLIGAGEAWGQRAAVMLNNDAGVWPGDGSYGVTSAASRYGAGHTLRWQPADGTDNANHVGGDYNQPYLQSVIDAQYDAQRASVDDWLAHPIPTSMQQAWGMDGYATGTGNWSMSNVAVTGDTESKGTEFELTANPIPGLDISINAARTDAKRLNLAKSYSDWIEARYALYRGPLGDMRIWGAGNWALQTGAGGTVRDKFDNEVMPAYQLALALNNTSVAELRPWRFNVTANYAFQSGFVKGLYTGVAYRWQDRQVVGFGLNSTNNGYDVNKRLYGPSEDAWDMWMGREFKISEKLRWRVQINVRDLFASKKLIPVTVQPDGSAGTYRIPEPRVITLTNTLEF